MAYNAAALPSRSWGKMWNLKQGTVEQIRIGICHLVCPGAEACVRAGVAQLRAGGWGAVPLLLGCNAPVGQHPETARHPC